MTQIIFNSQEEFEDAVMETLKKRLSITLESESGFNLYTSRVEVLLGEQGGDYFTSSSTTV